MSLAVLLLSFAMLPWGQQRAPASATQKIPRSPAESAAQKFSSIEQNAKMERPNPEPTVLTQREVNAYLSSGGVKLPQGVQSAEFKGRPGEVEALLRVDFDAITASRTSFNPLLVLFSGIHDVLVLARAQGSAGLATVQVESVQIDGVQVPRAALQFFMDRYITPAHPGVKLDSQFKMPLKIDRATVEEGQISITQK
jgi:hypothetical protein